MAREELKAQLVAECRDLIQKIKIAGEEIQERQRKLSIWNKELQALSTTMAGMGWDEDFLAAELFVKEPSKGKQIASAVEQIFKGNNNEWLKLQEIIAQLRQQDIAPGGKNPQATLSAHLSNSGLFEGDRSKGWRLKPPPLKVPLAN